MNNGKTVVLGLSGGVDSAVAALLLKKQGYNVIAAFMKNFSDTKNPLTGECSWRQEFRDAQEIAALLQIPLHVFDFEKEYKTQVIEPMFKGYEKGITPNPDIACNTIIKFPLFWKHAKKLGTDYIAMGHYAIIKKDSKGYHLLQGKDKTKDQTYFLAGLNQDDLSHTLFPIGKYTKSEVRAIAEKNGFHNANKKGTRGICFVGKVDMKEFLEKKIKNKMGKVFSPEGKNIGTHCGTSYYTIGQKVGPHIGIIIQKEKGKEQKRWYVAEKLKNNILIVAPEGHQVLKKKEIALKQFHQINKKQKVFNPTNLKARIRHLGKLHSGKLLKQGNKIIFKFARPVEAIADGQELVVYKGRELIASGEIYSK